MKEACEATFEWMDIVQTSAPKSKTTLVFTQDDLIENNKQEKIREIKQQFRDLFQKQQAMEKRHLHESDSADNKVLYTAHVQNYQDLINQLDSTENIPCISCLPGKEESLAIVVKLMLTFANNVKNEVRLSRTDQDLFKEIGTLGLKKDFILQDDWVPVTKKQKTAKEVIEKTETTVVIESHGVTKEPKFQRPESTVDTIERLGQQYLTLKEARKIFHPILMKHCPGKDLNLEKQLQKSLMNLNKLGLIRYFTGSDKLSEIIFNNISTMVNILRCVFYHELEEFPEFMNLDRNLRQGLDETKYNQSVEYLRKHAIISSALVKILLTKSECIIEEDIVLELLTTLNIVFPIIDEQNQVAFIPYFLRETEPNDFIQEKCNILKCQDTTLSLHSILKGQISRTYFNELMVKMYGKIYQKCTRQKQNKTWVNGLTVSLGYHKAKLLLLYEPTKKIIEFIIQANIEDTEGHKLLFENVKFIVDQSKQIRDARFEGLPIIFKYRCTDCKIKKRGSKQHCEWDILELLQKCKSSDMPRIRCENATADFPCALLQELPKGKPPSDRTVLYRKSLEVFINLVRQ